MRQKQWTHWIAFLEKHVLLIAVSLLSNLVSASSVKHFPHLSCVNSLLLKTTSSVFQTTRSETAKPFGLLQSLASPNPPSEQVGTYKFIRNLIVTTAQPQQRLSNNMLFETSSSLVLQEPRSLVAFMSDPFENRSQLSWKQSSMFNRDQQLGFENLLLQKTLFECYKSGALFCELLAPNYRATNARHSFKEKYLLSANALSRGYTIIGFKTTPITEKSLSRIPKNSLELSRAYAKSFFKSLSLCQNQGHKICVLGSSYLSSLAPHDDIAEVSTVFISSSQTEFIQRGEIFKESFLASSKSLNQGTDEVLAYNTYLRAVTACYKAGYTLCSISMLVQTEKTPTGKQRIDIFVDGLDIALPGASAKGNFVNKNI